MSRSLKTCLVAVLALGLAAIAAAEDPRSESERTRGFFPGGLGRVDGPIFEEALASLEQNGVFAPTNKKFVGHEKTLEGNVVTTVKYVYRDQPPEFQIYPTTNSTDPIIYMTAQFEPAGIEIIPGACSAFVRFDFNAQVSLVPSRDGFAGLAYAIYVKQDTDTGNIEFPGEVECSQDDICGYLEQTQYWLWLAASSKVLDYTSTTISHFFEARMNRVLEVQVHLFPIYDPKHRPGEVYVNAGFIGLTSGM